MDIVIKWIIIFAFTVPLQAISVVPLSPDDFSQKSIFNNWLLNRCIGKIEPESKMMDDAFKSAAVWLEFSKLPTDAFNEGDGLVEKYLKLNFDGSVKSDYNVLKCTLLASSHEATSLFEKHDI
ncbi:T6SS amidase immunity protein Tai4 family protein [Winslowiella iniecta]|uniref:Type VI secretion protein n=1 Tax=Winslowiella iniecta TaxID=1560201 RepID=A0A0L7SY58_9GAMM|nr:T6SS amidase immunity protein Tai4 family protein [Winslowiella iniecta]KOC88084.1 hypothetical protein NG42_17840 [Winslowiella iniecta]KOC89667.1 hypothetical protein NG43_18555 [Winslowiella iniecta]